MDKTENLIREVATALYDAAGRPDLFDVIIRTLTVEETVETCRLYLAEIVLDADGNPSVEEANMHTSVYVADMYAGDTIEELILDL